MDPILSGVAAAVLTEGVAFLYQQAGEVLSAWRSRRRDPSVPPPRLIAPPSEVTVAHARPMPEPASAAAVDTLEQLRYLAEPIKDGVVDVESPAAREAIASLRDMIEAALQARISFAGELPRPLRIADVEVVAHRVSGRVTGLRADLAKLASAEIGGVRVQTDDVDRGGEVTGLDLT
jgi:hypothetical protein